MENVNWLWDLFSNWAARWLARRKKKERENKQSRLATRVIRKAIIFSAENVIKAHCPSGL